MDVEIKIGLPGPDKRLQGKGHELIDRFFGSHDDAYPLRN